MIFPEILSTPFPVQLLTSEGASRLALIIRVSRGNIYFLRKALRLIKEVSAIPISYFLPITSTTSEQYPSHAKLKPSRAVISGIGYGYADFFYRGWVPLLLARLSKSCCPRLDGTCIEKYVRKVGGTGRATGSCEPGNLRRMDLVSADICY